MVEWLEYWDGDQHGLGSKSMSHSVAILGKTLYDTFPAWLYLEAVLNFSISLFNFKQATISWHVWK